MNDPQVLSLSALFLSFLGLLCSVVNLTITLAKHFSTHKVELVSPNFQKAIRGRLFPEAMPPVDEETEQAMDEMFSLDSVPNTKEFF